MPLFQVHVQIHSHENESVYLHESEPVGGNGPFQEKMRGHRGRLPVQPLLYVMSTKAIFRRAEVFVLAEVCLPRRPHASRPRSDV